MMSTEHPITPPPDLMEQWLETWLTARGKQPAFDVFLATRAARWGADQELEACCEYLGRCAAWEPEDVKDFCDLRRPKPPSLKEQALQAMCRFMDSEGHDGLTPEEVSEDFCLIRRALEALPDE